MGPQEAELLTPFESWTYHAVQPPSTSRFWPVM
ncbi:MAG: hypothetical protein ACI93T_000534 [Porticoccaceae bacterium]|jgi:hypothetical protein